MDERGANIDLLFRNGLKDYEVLPPPEVWNNIHQDIKGIPKSFRLMRAAAIIAILVSLSFLTYQLTRDIPLSAELPVLTINVESMTPLFAPKADNPVKIVTAQYVAEIVSTEASPSVFQLNALVPENKLTALSESSELTEIRMASIKYSLQHGPIQTSGSFVKKKTYEFTLTDPKYMPETATVDNLKRWSIGAMASPTYYSAFSSDNTELAKQLASSEQSVISYSGGVAMAYKLNKRFSIQSGIYYSSLGQEVNGISSFGGFQKYVYTKGDHNFEVQTTSGPIYANNPDIFLSSTGQGERISTSYTRDVFDPEKVNLQYMNSSLIQNFSYLEFPMILRYKLIDRALDFSFIGGVSYNFLVSNSVYTTYGGEKYQVGETMGLNPLTLSSSLGMGLEYSFSNNLSLNLEPTFRYFLNQYDQVAGSKNHPYTFGVFSGLSYKF